MAFFTAGGVDIELVEFRELAPDTGGSRVRAYDGTLRLTQRYTKRSWSATTRPMTVAEITTALAALAFGTRVACGGTAFKFAAAGTITCVLEQGETPYIPWDGDTYGWQGQLSFVVVEA